MSPKPLFLNPPLKLKSYQNDLAPLDFFFDKFITDLFKIPITPIPMRIDKLTNGQLTLFLSPDKDKFC